MTPQKIADISEPIEQLYSDLTDELLINIAKHLSRSTATWSALHEIETLEEMGQLTQENIEIINTYVAKMPQEIKDAMNESRKEALGEIEQKLADAAAKGYLTTPVSDSTVDVVQAFSNQAAEQLNLVNQTMLNTSLQQYQSGIYEFRREMQNAAPKTIENEQELELAQQQIDLAAGKTVTGTETRYNAMRQAIRNLNKAGIVGYYDRANRAWTAEAYVNMDIRTTVHNTYIQSVQTRQQDYGSDVFQVSAHAGARPLCYPYQGKLYSWSGSGGYIRLGDGKQHRFEPIGSTSYGEPAGLFGINCGHVPYPMIPDVSEMVDEKIQSEEENTKQYQESQKQRALERQIRYAKRNVEMLGSLATEADKDKIKQAQANMRAFIKETGRTRRYDREQIVTQRGSTSVKPTTRTPLKTNPVTPITSTKANGYINAINIEEAEKKANYFTDASQWAATGVSYKGISVDVANVVNKTLTDFYDKYNVNKFGGVIAPTGNSKEGKLIQNATAAYSPVRNSFLLSRKALKDMKTADTALKAEKEVVTDYLKNPDKYDITKMSARAYRVLENSKVSGRGTVPDTIEEVINHELGHSLEKQLSNNTNLIALKQRMEQYAPKISGYACESWSEYVAESFASYNKGENVADPELIKAFKELERTNNE